VHDAVGLIIGHKSGRAADAWQRAPVACSATTVAVGRPAFAAVAQGRLDSPTRKEARHDRSGFIGGMDREDTYLNGAATTPLASFGSTYSSPSGHKKSEVLWRLAP
jgi:hypothetical protein